LLKEDTPVKENTPQVKSKEKTSVKSPSKKEQEPTPVKKELDKKEVDASPDTKLVKSKKEESSLASMIRSKIPQYSSMTMEDQYKHRSTFKARFELIKESWHHYNVPDLDNMTLEAIHECYEIYIKNIKVTESSGKYKVYLVILWLFIEYMCCRLGLNISGYTMTQLKAMNKYETLLIKLGEKNYKTSFGEEREQWPVEFDILFMALINAVTFIVIKMLCDSINLNDKLAENAMEMISTYLSGAAPQPGNVLFGGNHVSEVPATTMTPGNLDLPNILASLGGMFMQKQKPAPQQQHHHADVPAKTPKFKPAYDD